MTIGVVTTSFPRWPGDFAGCFIEDAVRATSAGGACVEVIAAGPPPPHAVAPTTWGRLDLAPQARVFRVPVPAGPGHPELFYDVGAPEVLERGGATAWAQSFFFWAGLCRTIRDRSQAGSWTRIVAHWLVPCALAARAAAPRLPVTAYAHSGDVALLERLPGGGVLARRLAHELEEVIFASDDLRRRFGRLAGRLAGRVAEHARQAAARRPSIDAVERKIARSNLGLTGRCVLSVGRLVPIKGFDILMRAAALASTAAGAPPLTVIILGDGPERARLEDAAHRLNIDLRLPGFVPRGDVSRWMAAADLYVQPSLRLASGRTEGLPTATLEALTAGLPVVASATGGLPELAGVRLVPPGDVGALSTYLRDPRNVSTA
jgi:glycosyltransferase involved in cell wall biosynthesis